MLYRSPVLVAGSVSLAVLIFSTLNLVGQEEGAPPAAPAQEEIVIKREALQVADSRAYRVPLQLVPLKTFDLTAPVDGYIRGVSGKAGDKTKKESTIFQLDNAIAAVQVKKARANVQAAKLEKKQADAKNDPDSAALGMARVEAAEAELELALLQEKQLAVRAPFEGDLIRVAVQDGQYVRAGEVLGTLIDTTKMQVELPVDRDAAKVGSSVDFKVEATAVQGKIQAVLPLAAKFDPLRELSEGLGSAIVEIENPGRKFIAGQTVHVDMIPAAPVAEVPTAAVTNLPDGNRKVQVLRDNVVRTITVAVHTRVGTERVFISGQFRKGDELILSSSKELADGTPVKALVAARATEGAANGGTPQAAATPKAAGKAAAKAAAVDGF